MRAYSSRNTVTPTFDSDICADQFTMAPSFPFEVLKEQATSEVQEDGDLRFVTPVPLRLALPRETAAHHSSFELRVEDWKNFVYLSPGLHHKPQVWNTSWRDKQHAQRLSACCLHAYAGTHA